MYSFFGGRDGSQMVEAKFCYLVSRAHPWADNVQLVYARTVDNLDQSLFPRSIHTFTHCTVKELDSSKRVRDLNRCLIKHGL